MGPNWKNLSPLLSRCFTHSCLNRFIFKALLLSVGQETHLCLFLSLKPYRQQEKEKKSNKIYKEKSCLPQANAERWT